MWHLLLIELPTQPNAVRVRIWRALKAIGSPSLRDGAYVLPSKQAHRFKAIADDIQAHGGSAQTLQLLPTSKAQQAEIDALFDRTQAYAEWLAAVQALGLSLKRLTESEARRQLRSLSSALDDLQSIDYHPGSAARQAIATLEDARDSVNAQFSPGEPRTASRRGVPRLDAANFRGKVWATRSRPWVDRLASAWLIGRFIDPKARFVWVDDTRRLPRGAVGYDFDGAKFSHVGARVTFEVLALSFGLDADPRVTRMGTLVRALDVGGLPVPEAAGLEAVLAGLRAQHTDDAALQTAALTVFDAFFAVPEPVPSRAKKSTKPFKELP
jgi:hypothetical protein